MKNLTKTHRTQLKKVATQLAYQQKMDGTQLILGTENRAKMEAASNLIYKAIDILHQIN
tara:strand:+ start:128 stop:304 length:177 start_codon:yes stop_codon:yes gene_type:complete